MGYPNSPYCWVIFNFTALFGGLLCKCMYYLVGKLFHISVAVVDKAEWSCCDELAPRSNILVFLVQ